MKSTLTPLQPTMEGLGTWLREQHPNHGIKATMLHHTWSPSSSQYRGRQTIVGIRNYHVNKRGWSDIGANLYAAPDGIVYTARPLSANNYAHAFIDDRTVDVGAKAISGGNKQWFNHHAIGLETIANFDSENPDGHPSLECALRVLTVVHQVYSLPVSRLFFHRDVSPKSCPGTKLNRANIRAKLNLRLTDIAMNIEPDVDEWAQPWVERAIDEGLLTGYPDGLFRGRQPVTRQELAVALVRFKDRLSLNSRLPSD